MGAELPLIIVTAVWGVIGGIVPWFIPKGPNKGIIQTMIVMTAVSCYLFWLCTFMMQLNPLIGPQLDNNTLYIIQHEWK